MSRWRRQLKKRHRRARERAAWTFGEGVSWYVRSLDGCVPIPTFQDVCEQNEKHRAFMRVINNVGRRGEG